MARLQNKKPPHKKVHTDRVRAPGTVVERWTNNKAAVIGLLMGQGRSAVEIASILKDGTSPETIRRMKALWNLDRYEVRRGLIVSLSHHKRRMLEQQAAKLQIEPEEFLKRICECTIGDSLYQAVTDGRYAV